MTCVQTSVLVNTSYNAKDGKEGAVSQQDVGWVKCVMEGLFFPQHCNGICASMTNRWDKQNGV